MGTSELIGLDIVIVGQQAWDTDIGSNCKNIALELSKTNRVLYVNSPLDRISRYRHRNTPAVKKRMEVVSGQSDGLAEIGNNLWILYPNCIVESINWLNNSRLFNTLNKRNNLKFAKSIKEALAKLAFRDFILFNDNEIFKAFYLKDLINPMLSVYYSRDYMLGVDYWKKHGQFLEPQLIAGSDLCVANSVYLADYCKQYNPNSYYVGQGCDFTLFDPDKAKRTPDLPIDNDIVIGYVGVLHELRLDIDVLLHIARSRPTWKVVLVGPESEFFMNSELHSLPNVLFIGKKNPAQLSDYIQAFNVCINPQLVNEVTIGNYPRKIDEYLAMGKPVVATHTRAMEIFSKHVFLCSSKEDYIVQIEKALAEDSEQLKKMRQDFAATHTWENSVGEIKKVIKNHLSQ